MGFHVVSGIGMDQEQNSQLLKSHHPRYGSLMQLSAYTSVQLQLQHQSWISTWHSVASQATLRHGPQCQHGEDITMTWGGRENHSENYVPQELLCDLWWQHVLGISTQLPATPHIMNICKALSGSTEQGHQHRAGWNKTTTHTWSSVAI